jgi:uncharacterized protein YlxP (DUF503 family)
MVLAGRFELRLPGTRSLKDKRSRIRPVIDRIRHRHHLSVAEVGHQDDLARSAIEVAVVSSSPAHASEVLDGIERLVWAADGVEVLSVERRWLDVDDD